MVIALLLASDFPTENPCRQKRNYSYTKKLHHLSNEHMNHSNKLLAIKLTHTLIWSFFFFVIVYILYSGITNRVTTFTWIGIGLIIAEGFILIVFKMFCPLTLLARKYSDSQKENFDIFLPNWLAKHNKLIFTSIFIVGLILVVTRVAQNQ